MNSMRIALFLVMITAALYASWGIFESLWHFGIGLSVVGLAMCVQGMLTYIEEHETDHMARYRSQVWARRDSDNN